MTSALLICSFLALGGYLFVSGFHDASNSVAVPVRTRALTPRVALSIAAFFNVIGMAMCAIFLQDILTPDWLNVPRNNIGLGMLLTAMLAQIIWGLITWRLRMPSSSTHALIGSLLGSLWAARAVDFDVSNPFTEPAFSFFVVPLVIVPLAVLALAWLAMFPLYRLSQRATPREVNKYSRTALSFTNSLISLGHGILSGQRALIIFVLICAAGQMSRTPLLTGAALVLFALALACGTLLGSWRISHTIAHKLVHLDPLRGAAAQTVTALSMILAPLMLNATVSSSHLTSTAVLGAGVNQRFSAVRPHMALRLALTWLATVPASFVISAIFFLALSPLLAA